LRQIVKAVQEVEFPDEIETLNRGEQVHKKSKLFRLYPFIDPSDGVLKVGGRLAFSEQIPDATRFPAILPKNCRLSTLIVEKYHKYTMHGGQHLCLAEIRGAFWIIAARTLVRNIIRNCVKCYRFNSRKTNPLMGDLPNERIQPSPPFTYVGLDFAGPFATKGYKTNEKSYVAVFVCFSTKAVHLEAVTSLSADHCAKSVHRFSARRGAPEAIFSDNGTNFIGTRRELTEIQAHLEHTFPHVAAQKGIQWCTIPPGSPHFGGLWEAAVKSMKLHLKKVIGLSVLTFEEFRTLLCDIEAIMNSRPLVPVSDDPNDLQALTPNMIVTAKTFRPHPLGVPKKMKSSDIRIHPHDRWVYVQSLVATFWARWSKEYVTALQAREKWAQSGRK
jgi:transposase InsO family protein